MQVLAQGQSILNRPIEFTTTPNDQIEGIYILFELTAIPVLDFNI